MEAKQQTNEEEKEEENRNKIYAKRILIEIATNTELRAKHVLKDYTKHQRIRIVQSETYKEITEYILKYMKKHLTTNIKK